jgi:hypothetical protein
MSEIHICKAFASRNFLKPPMATHVPHASFKCDFFITNPGGPQWMMVHLDLIIANGNIGNTTIYLDLKVCK